MFGGEIYQSVIHLLQNRLTAFRTRHTLGGRTNAPSKKPQCPQILVTGQKIIILVHESPWPGSDLILQAITCFDTKAYL